VEKKIGVRGAEEISTVSREDGGLVGWGQLVRYCRHLFVGKWWEGELGISVLQM